MNRIHLLALSAVLLTTAVSLCHAADKDAKSQDKTARGWEIRLQDFFSGGTKPLVIYTREKDGQWLGSVGSSRDPSKRGAKKTYSTSWYYVDLSTVPIKDGKVKGRFTVYMTPDLWVPTDHKPFRVVFDIDATVNDEGKINGTWEAVKVTSDDPTTKGFGKKGKVVGWSNPQEEFSLPEDVTLTMNMQGALVGGKPSYGNRCMVVWVSAKGNEIASLSHGLISKKGRAYNRTPVSGGDSKVKIDENGFSGKVSIPARTLDMEPAVYTYEFEGRFLSDLIVGKYTLTVSVKGKEDQVLEGSFDGNWKKGIDELEAPDNRPWFSEVKGHKPPKPGEHPRLLFRKDDLPALRKRMKTEQGQAILKRLGFLLDGKNGETMTEVLSDATHAYMGGGYRSTTLKKPGAYTIGHAAGYGMLYQLTGEKKYAEFGRKCFELALEGQRDRDDRYSFRKPGGALRAGPSLGWYAVGYDLLYDALDEETRKKFTLAIAKYSEGENKDKAIDLETLARGTMPPSSNHFGMQVGGASLALLAISGEKWVDQDRIDTLLQVVRQSVIRNMSQGFGDGGFFAEGDGTGSMSSQIDFISALQAWRNVKGLDFVDVDRPNARMMSLKWVYQTVFRDGRPDFWPIRGSYGHNVWARGGMSGAAYFALGFAGVKSDQRPALKYCYDRFLLEADRKSGHPFDTASAYPQYTVSAFVNWPIGTEGEDPAKVLPLCFRDSHWGFYAWRNRWKDENDTVITILTKRTSGYMAAKPDPGLKLNSMGKHSTWADLKRGGAVKSWQHSPMGQTSSLRLEKAVVGVDFTGASGEEVMLVTTAKADGQTVKLDGRKVTIHFPTAGETMPAVEVKDGKIVAGNQTVAFDKEGSIVWGVPGK
ncbi:MAG: hypothetical protein ACLFV7_10350 [Phycisphaerae bacterium]